jgi:hypothetical protein
VAAFPEPTEELDDTRQVLLGYLDFFRTTVEEKVRGIRPSDQARSILPTGWTPLELVKHLTFMERRWLVWGFLGEQLQDPYGDDDPSGRWRVGPEETADTLLEALRAGGRRTREVVSRALLSDRARLGGRFTDAPPPALERILLHVLQEYARHVGHLDIVRELVQPDGGGIGE